MHPAKHGLVTLLAFVAAGAVPLLPFMVSFGPSTILTASIVLTFTTLFVIGALRAVATIDRWWLRAWRCCSSALSSPSPLMEGAQASGGCPAWPGVCQVLNRILPFGEDGTQAHT